MSSSETETVTLNLDGDFAAKAEKSAAAADKLGTSIDKMGSAGGKAAADNLEKSADEADKLGKKTKDASGTLEKMAGGAEKLASSFLSVGAAVGAVVTAARAVDEEIKHAIDTVTNLEAEIGLAGAKMAVLQSSKKEVESAAFKKLGGDYEKAVKVAVKLGLNEDEAVADVKKMLNAGFAQSDVELMLKIKAGMGPAGQDPAAFFTEMQKLKLEPKVKAKDLDGVWKLGIDSKKVYADLDKQLGGTGKALAALKKGTLDSGMVQKAIMKEALAKYGALADIAGNTVPALLARMKSGFEHLFDGVTMEPIKVVLKNILAELEGGGGKKLKAGINDIFGSMGVALDSVKSKGGIHKVFDEMAAAAHRAAAEIRALKPVVDGLLALLQKLDKSGAAKDAIEVAKKAAKEKAYEAAYEADLAAKKARIATGKGSFADYVDVINDKMMSEKEKRMKGEVLLDEAEKASKGGAAAAPTTNAAAADTNTNAVATDTTAAAKATMDASAMDTGAALPAGMAEGIMANESQAIEAAEQMAEKALQAAKDKLGVRSPSDAYGEVGAYSAEGYADKLESHPGPAKAAASMAQNALSGAAGAGLASMGGAGGGAGGGAAGGGAPTMNVVINGGGNAAEIKKMMLTEVFPQWLAMNRRAARDGMSGARAF